MGRNPIITADQAVKAIQSSDSLFASTGDIANYLDVTQQAVRDCRKRLADDPRIKIESVANNTVFYLSDNICAGPAELPDNVGNGDGGYKITVDEMVQSIADAKGPVTEADIAKACGVTRPTVAKYREELQGRSSVEHGDVGGATAYWLAGDTMDAPAHDVDGQFTCPSCRGEFPAPDDSACPWCGQAMGKYDPPERPARVSRVVDGDDADADGLLGVFR